VSKGKLKESMERAGLRPSKFFANRYYRPALAIDILSSKPLKLMVTIERPDGKGFNHRTFIPGKDGRDEGTLDRAMVFIQEKMGDK